MSGQAVQVPVGTVLAECRLELHLNGILGKSWNVYQIAREQLVASQKDEVFTFFADATNLEKLTPSFLRFRILTPTPIEMGKGTRIEYAISLFGVPMKWRTYIAQWQPGLSFVDEQESGPYAMWRHTHEFEAQGAHTLIRDRVEYALPFGLLGRLAHALFVRRTLNKIFDFRREAVSHSFGRVRKRQTESQADA